MGPGALTYQQQVAADEAARQAAQQPQGFPTATASQAPAAAGQGVGEDTRTFRSLPEDSYWNRPAFGTSAPDVNAPVYTPVTKAEKEAYPSVAKDEKKLTAAEEEVARAKTLTDEAIAKAPGHGVPNPYASPAPQGGGGGGPAAAPFDPAAYGYAALGVNAKDPKQAAAGARVGQEAKASEELAARQEAEAVQQGRLQQAQVSGQAMQMRSDAIAEEKFRHDASEASRPHFERYQQMQADLANEKIDPDLIYRGAAGGARRVMSALGVALGAVGAVYGHTENFAQKIVEQQVNNSIDAQKANLANKRQVAEGEKGVYQMMREQGADDATARSATRALAYASAAKDAEAFAVSAKTDDQRRAAEQQAQQLKMQAAQAEQKFTMDANAKGQEHAETLRKEALAAQKAAGAGMGEDAKDVGGDLAAQWLRDHPDEVASAYSKGGRFWNWMAERTGLDFDSPENKAARHNVERVIGGQMVGRVNDERLERGERKYARTPEDVQNLTDAQYREQIRKERIKNKGKPSREEEGPP